MKATKSDCPAADGRFSKTEWTDTLKEKLSCNIIIIWMSELTTNLFSYHHRHWPCSALILNRYDSESEQNYELEILKRQSIEEILSLSRAKLGDSNFWVVLKLLGEPAWFANGRLWYWNGGSLVGAWRVSRHGRWRSLGDGGHSLFKGCRSKRLWVKPLLHQPSHATWPINDAYEQTHLPTWGFRIAPWISSTASELARTRVCDGCKISVPVNGRRTTHFCRTSKVVYCCPACTPRCIVRSGRTACNPRRRALDTKTWIVRLSLIAERIARIKMDHTNSVRFDPRYVSACLLACLLLLQLLVLGFWISIKWHS